MLLSFVRRAAVGALVALVASLAGATHVAAQAPVTSTPTSPGPGVGTPGDSIESAGGRGRPYGVSDLVDDIGRKMPVMWLIGDVRKNCLAAALSEADERRLQRAGADAGFIGALRKSCVAQPLASASVDASGGLVTPVVRDLQRGCERGSAAACDSVADKYVEGIFAPKSRKMAAEYLLKSCTLGARPSCTRAIDVLKESLDPSDHARAAAVLTVRCEQGERGDCRRLGEFYQRGIGTAKDGERALVLYRLACESGVADACGDASTMLLAGDGVPLDSAKGYGFLARSCELATTGQAVPCARAGLAFARNTGAGADPARTVTLYRRACEADDAVSCNDLGDYILTRQPAGVTPADAAGFLDKACTDGRTRACVRLAALLADGSSVPQNYQRAAALLDNGCKGGVLTACSDLAAAYAAGRGVPTSAARAAELLGKACDASLAASCRILAGMTLRGDGVTRSTERAMALFDKACTGSDLGGCGDEGRLIATAAGAPAGGPARDMARARTLLTRACDGALLAYCVDLGDALTSEARPDSAAVRQSVALFQRACEGKVAAGCTHLGRALAAGAGVEASPDRAVALFDAACKAGDAGGCASYGAALASGAGGREDAGAAVPVLEKSCTMGSGVGCNALADLYWRGTKPVSKDRTRAVTLYGQGCTAGGPPREAAGACANLGHLLTRGDNVAKDEARGAEMLQRGCDGGEARACGELATAYEGGRGVPADGTRAQALYTRACEMGWGDKRCRR